MYRLSWLETWSERHYPPEGVSVEYLPNDDWWDHEFTYYFPAKTDEEAKQKALAYIDNNTSAVFEVWSLYRHQPEDPIMTEEYYEQ